MNKVNKQKQQITKQVQLIALGKVTELTLGTGQRHHEGKRHAIGLPRH